jgi:hypothetical protein
MGDTPVSEGPYSDCGGIMTGESKKHPMHIPEAKPALWKLFELVMGPGLMLVVLIALAAHLVISNQTGELKVYTAHQHPSGS